MNRLPSDVVSALRTDVTITSVPQCVTELVLNSIDAKATSIAVRVDLNLFKIQVIDNGCGISQNDLSLLGHRYMTSKCHSLNDLRSNLSSFGFRGEALASLCEVAGTVMITSRPSGSDSTYCKIITQGRHQKVVHSSRPRPAQGTTILIGDFLYNRPVRRARIKAAFDLEEIKSHLENIALIHPQVSLSLRDDSNGQMVLETKKTNSIVDTFGLLFGRAIAETLCPVKGSSKPFEVSGYISKEAYSHKNLQFIYINKRLLLKSKLHKLVNSIMGRSSILKMNNVPQNPISKELNSAFFLAMSPPKRSKHAVYILNVTCPYSEYDITLDPKKTLIEFEDWEIILNCFEKLLRDFVEPQVSPLSPVNESSVLDEINRLAREDAMVKGGEPPTTLGTRTMLGLPARRDTIIYTPPSQYTEESTIVSSASEKESFSSLTTNSEDPFPAHLRGKAPQSASTEDPFLTKSPPTRNPDFVTSQEDSSTASTKDFLTMFKQPVFHKLKHQKPHTKLPVGDSVHFDLNLQRITNMFRPVGLAREQVDADGVERTKLSIVNSLQKFSKEKSVQMSTVSTDTAKYHTPLNAQRQSEINDNVLSDSVPDLLVSELKARLGTPSNCETAVQNSPLVSHQDISPEDTGVALEENPETILEKHLVSNDLRESSTDDSVPEFVEICASADELQNSLLVPTSDEAINGDKYSEQENQSENVLHTTKVYMRSEDFLVTRDDVIENSNADDFGYTSTSTVSSQADTDSLLKECNVQEDNLSTLMELLQTDSDYVYCSQPTPNSDYDRVVLTPAPESPIVHQENSEELVFLNTQQSSTDSQNITIRSSPVENSDSTVPPVTSPHSFHSEQACEGNLQISPNSLSLSNLFLKASETSPEKANPILINSRKRNVEKDNTDDSDEPLKKIISFEKSGTRNSENTDTAHCDTHLNTPREIEIDPKKDSPEKSKSMNFDDSPNSVSSSSRLKRHTLVLNCSIANIIAALSPGQNRILNEDKKIEETKLKDTNEIVEATEEREINMEVEASKILEQASNETNECLPEETRQSINESRNSLNECNDATEELETEDRDFQHTDQLPFSSSCEGSLIAVYEQTMLEMCDRRETAPEVAPTDFTEGESDKSGVWEERTDHSGRKYFVHSIHGTIRFHQDSTQRFTMENRCSLLPKELSSLAGSVISSEVTDHFSSTTKDSGLASLIDQNNLATAKWPNGKPENVEKPWRLVDQLLTNFEPDNEVPVTSAIIQEQAHSQINVYNVCYPYTFNKDIFSSLVVLGQLDRKFIVTIAKVPSETEQSQVVILFDQHAVHERIRVEQLTKEYREVGEGIVWRSAPVHPALPLSLSAREVRVMTNCTEKVRALGLRFSKTDSHSVRITGVPTCLLLREDRQVHGRGTSVLKSHLESLIREEVDALVQTRGAGVEQPSIIRNVIASEACRGAVKFGHPLETEDCRAFLQNLACCALPFQCAHGRPALTPIADLSHLPKASKTRKPNLWKLRRT